MLVSTDGGATWDRTYLPTMNGERVRIIILTTRGQNTELYSNLSNCLSVVTISFYGKVIVGRTFIGYLITAISMSV